MRGEFILGKRGIFLSTALLYVFGYANEVNYTPFPSNKVYEYPTKWSEIQTWIDNNNFSKVREHGWRLFVGVNQPASDNSSKRVFETWYSLPETFAKKSQEATLTAVNGKSATSIQTNNLSHRMTLNEKQNVSYGDNALKLQPDYNSQCGFAGANFLNNGDIMIAGVFYSQEFYSHVRDNNYYNSDHLNSLWQGESTAIKNFPNKSFQVKHMYWPVPKDGVAVLPVFPDYNPAPDPNNLTLPVKPMKPANYNGYETWRKAVAITTNATLSGSEVNASYAWGEFYNIPAVNVKNFYYREVTENDYKSFDDTDKCILNQSANAVYGRNFEVGDYLVTVAMHVMVREDADIESGLMPNAKEPTEVVNTWSMQTFWYAGSEAKPNFKSRYSSDKPQDLKDKSNGVWQNYAMCQSYDFTKPLEGDGTPHVCSNPYIELVFPETYRSVSSCITCHTAGAYPANKNLTDTMPGRAHYDSVHRGFVPTKYFRSMLYTDFSWSTPLSAQPSE